jgi:hypothetical protein
MLKLDFYNASWLKQQYVRGWTYRSSDTLSWFQAKHSLILLLLLKGEATNINFIVFGLSLLRLELMIYTCGEYANHYTIDAVSP